MAIPEIASLMEINSYSLERRASASIIEVTLATDALDPRVIEASATGAHFDVVMVSSAAGTLTLRGVVINDLSLGESISSVFLDSDMASAEYRAS